MLINQLQWEGASLDKVGKLFYSELKYYINKKIFYPV
jgi:hypothetical protein